LILRRLKAVRAIKFVYFVTTSNTPF